MKPKYLFWLLPLLLLLLGAAVLTPGKKTSEYPHTSTAPDSALLLLAITNVAVPTNNNISVLELAQQFTNGLATTGYVNTVGTTVSNGVVTLVTLTSNGLVTFTLTTSNSIFNLSQSAGSNLVVVLSGTNTFVTMTSTNGTNFYTVNSTASGGVIGTTNFMNLSVQAAKLPATNYPGIDAGWQAWETVYYETNAEGARVTLEANWQFMVPHDYSTNSLQLLINYSLLATNGPNASNVIFGVSCNPIRSGTTNNVHTNGFGFTAWGTNDWIAKYDGTNIVTNLVINLGTNAAFKALDLSVLKLSRDAVNDTYGGAVSVHALQLMYTRQ